VHVFRFFVDEVGAAGQTVELDSFDAHHARVLHGAQAGAAIEVVDGAAQCWRGRFDGPTGRVVLEEQLGALREPQIVLYAGVLVGGKVDEVVDGATQAGATRIVPVVRSARDRAKLDQRFERLMRIATSAAKQAKRAAVPAVRGAIEHDELVAVEPGVLLDGAAGATLDEVLRDREPGTQPIRLFVGAADGIDPQLQARLVAAGWTPARLGPSILRSELAATVAVAIAAMHATHA
jgi:16S rRNA (uracil1498-N3)-methyltransferase